MRAFLSVILLVLLKVGFAHAKKPIANVVVFTNHANTIEVAKSQFDAGLVTIHNVDAFIDAETSLNMLLEEQAKMLSTPSVYARMNEDQLMALYQKAYQKLTLRPQYAEVVDRLQTSSLSLTKLLTYDIKALPAIVINDQVVIYGYRNVGQAISLYERVEN